VVERGKHMKVVNLKIQTIKKREKRRKRTKIWLAACKPNRRT